MSQFEVNFFKPKSAHARSNQKAILTLAIIWAVAVFGFQFLLVSLNKPVPEKTYETFQAVWPQVVEDSTATLEMKQDFARTLLMVLSKNIAVKPEHKKVLKDALAKTVYSMQSEEDKPAFLQDPTPETIQMAVNSIGLSDSGMDKLLVNQLAFSLQNAQHEHLCAKCKAAISVVMERYLVHNRNALTDFTFLGFPFHYWYTAQFLLILFVGLCLIYAVIIDKINKKHEFDEEA